MELTTIRLVAVGGGKELSRAETQDDGSVTYSGGLGALQGVVRTTMRDEQLDEAAALRRLAETGWSNGYSMVVAGE